MKKITAEVETTYTLNLGGGVTIRDAACEHLFGLTIWRGELGPETASVVTLGSDFEMLIGDAFCTINEQPVIAASPNVCAALKASATETDPKTPAETECWMVGRLPGHTQPGDALFLVRADAEDDRSTRNSALKQDEFKVERWLSRPVPSGEADDG